MKIQLPSHRPTITRATLAKYQRRVKRWHEANPDVEPPAHILEKAQLVAKHMRVPL